MPQRTILVKVKQSNLTLGVTKYKKGDIFECREQEALMLMHAGILERAQSGARPTKEPPMPGKTGLSNLGVPTAQKPAEQPKAPPPLPPPPPPATTVVPQEEPMLGRRKKKRAAEEQTEGETPISPSGDELTE